MNYDSTEDANFKRDCFENNIKRTKCYANREQLAFSTYAVRTSDVQLGSHGMKIQTMAPTQSKISFSTSTKDIGHLHSCLAHKDTSLLLQWPSCYVRNEQRVLLGLQKKKEKENKKH